MRYADIDKRLKTLEDRVPDPAGVGRIVLVDVVELGRRLPEAERERRIAEGRRAAGPRGMVVIADCPTCGGDE